MREKCRDFNAKTALIIGAGGLLRLFYVLFSTIYERQYDIGMIDLDAGHTVSGGHLAYIQYLYENMRLPDIDPTTVYQFHHPPLHHLICALWMRFCTLFISDTAVLEESMQAVPFVCSLLILWVSCKILKQFELSENTIAFLMALFAFHPALVLLSGSVNNDCMALLFTLLTVYTTIEWSRRRSPGWIIGIALSIALGMCTKQNVAEMAFPIAAVFLYVLVKEWKKSGFPKKLFGQFAVFGVVSVPLGMSFYLRNLIRYNTPIVWVYELAEDSWQYTGNVPVINRFLWPVPAEMVDNLKNFRIGCGYNVWMQIIRTSVLGEWDMANVGRMVKLLAVGLMFLGAVLAVLALAAFLDVFVIRTKNYVIDVPGRIMCLMGYAVNMLFYLTFAYKYPQECSMHFRYIEITLLFPAIALGYVLQKTGKKWLRAIAALLLAAFAVCSVLMTVVWGMLEA